LGKNGGFSSEKKSFKQGRFEQGGGAKLPKSITVAAKRRRGAKKQEGQNSCKKGQKGNKLSGGRGGGGGWWRKRLLRTLEVNKGILKNETPNGRGEREKTVLDPHSFISVSKAGDRTNRFSERDRTRWGP